MSKVQDKNAKHVDDEKKAMKPLDHRLMAGPLQERGCTDFICFILFILSFCLMWAIAGTGYQKGQPRRLAAAYDSDKNACGLDLPNYPYLYFPILSPQYYNHTTCVDACPVNITFQNQPASLNCSNNSVVPSCQTNCLNFDFTNASSLKNFSSASLNISQFFCIYSTQLLFNRVCFPQYALGLLNQTQNFSSTVDVDRMTAWMNDLNTAKWTILGSFGFAFILGIAYMILVRYIAGLLVWLSILLYFVCLAVLGGFCYKKSVEYKTGVQTADAGSGTNAADSAQALLIISVVILAAFVLSVVIFLCMFNKIRLAIAIIKTATLFVRDNFLVIFVPPVISVVCLALYVWWIISVVYIISLGQITGSGTGPFAQVTFDPTTRKMIWYFVFGGLWKNAFLLSLCQFIIASTCCIWYFSQGSGQKNNTPITTSVYRAFRYHLGSLAFGSLILAIVQFIRIVLTYMQWQAKRMGGQNRFTKCILDCLQCYVACFERFIEFLNKNAYIQIALTGKSFCPAAKEAFETIWANSGRYGLVGGIGGAFNFIGKLFISTATVVGAYLILTTYTYYLTNLISPILPCIVIFVIAYGIAILFMSIYSMACDTVLTCYIYDEELNKQSGGGSAQHCPETLREFFDNQDKKT